MKIAEIIFEGKRIPRKKGQKRKSKKHSDLYTDEDPKGTIHGLGFKDRPQLGLAWQKLGSLEDHMHTKYKPLLQWSNVPEPLGRLDLRQYIVSLLTA